MRVVFMGSPDFAVPSLQALVEAHDVVAVFTAPDRVRSRGKKVTPTPVKECALEAGIPVHQPSTLRDESAQKLLSEYDPDVVCVAAYGHILTPEVLALPPHGCINVHASLLPAYRGAAPIHRAILAGDPIAGVTIMQMEAGLDTGPMASIRSMPIGGLAVSELTAHLAVLGAEALIETLGEIEAGNLQWIPQDASRATYAAKITDADLRLTPEITVETASRMVRASSASARAKMRICDRTLDVLEASVSETPVGPGELVQTPDGLVAGFADGGLLLEFVCSAGKAPVCGKAFACGLRLADDTRWEP
ncbi:MAG: methionyl-tRNA formyltransferase, partial [Actinobacteria bacterium]|nr:methionyl-tRNA formyltransferase [Actinomycetota bacterium]